MARINDDGLHGMLGPLITYVRKGKRVVRTKPASFTDAETPRQLKHREKIRLAGIFTKTSKKFITIGYQQATIDSPSNEARSFIIKNCFVDADPLPYLDYSKVLISRGTIQKPLDALAIIKDNEVQVTWNNQRIPGIFTDMQDNVMIMMYCIIENEGYSYFFPNIAKRIDGTATVKIPRNDLPLHIWMFYNNSDVATFESKNKISDSVYLGMTNP